MRRNSDVRFFSRKGSSDVAIIASVSVALMLAAGGYFFFHQQKVARQEAEIAKMEAMERALQADKAATEAKARQQAKLEQEQAQAKPQADDNSDQQVAQAEAVTLPVVPTPQVATAATSESVSTRDLILAHLEFGEYANAIDLANSVEDTTQRSELLKLVADAQVEIGDFAAALGSIRRIPNEEERTAARENRTTEQAMAGGAQADFTQLIELIQSETSGEWEEIDGQGGTISEFAQGVHVDPKGVLMLVTEGEHADRLKELGIKARQSVLNSDLAKGSNMRVISLTRLEADVAKRIGEGKEPTESQKLLGGLTKITNVFVYPEDNDIVLVGPAEKWNYNENGVPVGADSGRPVLQLDDLVTCLRAFQTNEQGYFSCSINPRKEGLRSLKEFVASTSSRPLRPGAGVRRWVDQLQQKLGRQDIVFNGIEPTSRVARVIIEADYRMKLVGIGKYDFGTGTKIPNIFQLMTAAEQKSGKLDALRWWLSMKYDSVLHSRDGNAFEFVGSSVLCQSENQFLNAQGQQVQTGQSEGSNRVFAETFTAKYDDLAKHDMVFADLQNVFDLALVASLLEHKQLSKKAQWNYGAFSSKGSYRTTVYSAPTEVDSVVNHRVFRGKDIVVQVAGGVRVDMAVAYNDRVFKEGARLESTSTKAKRSANLQRRKWWWDAN